MNIRDGYEALRGVRDEHKNIIVKIYIIKFLTYKFVIYCIFTDYLEIQEHVQRVDKTYQPMSL